MTPFSLQTLSISTLFHTVISIVEGAASKKAYELVAWEMNGTNDVESSHELCRDGARRGRQLDTRIEHAQSLQSRLGPLVPSRGNQHGFFGISSYVLSNGRFAAEQEIRAQILLRHDVVIQQRHRADLVPPATALASHIVSSKTYTREHNVFAQLGGKTCHIDHEHFGLLQPNGFILFYQAEKGG